MRTVIYYFSATGNSLVVARDLAAALDATLIPIANAMRTRSFESAERVGIVYPVYMFGLPLIARDFLKKIEVKQNAYIFCVATLGGLPGLAHTQAKDILKARGISLAAGFSVLMPGNYTPLYGAAPQEKQNKMFEKAKAKVAEIARFVQEGRSGYFEEKPYFPNFLLHKLLYAKGSAQIPLADKGFWVTGACIKCGLCAQVCPVANIELRNGRPTWLRHCQQCMACLQWCPVEAIQYDKSTKGRKRYHHPAVSAQDIMLER